MNYSPIAFVVVLLGGVVGFGLINHALWTAGFESLSRIVWAGGYLGTALVLWYGWLRPIDLEGI